MIVNKFRKDLVFAVLILFICINITQSTAFNNVKKSSMFISDNNNLYVDEDGSGIISTIKSELTFNKNIITVDDEPGDADFTSIKEALNYSSPGDTIQVYSGTYPEDGIRILKDNITLLGIAHENGGGDDSGKPFIKGVGNNGVIKVLVSYVTVSNFSIEATGGVISICIWVRAVVVYQQDNITISDCILRNLISISLSTNGIRAEAVDKNISIMNNEISNCSVGINSWGSPRGLEITGNIITDCEVGISLGYNQQNVSKNIIKRCSRNGIQLHGANNIIYGNDIENCPIGIYSPVLEPDETERGNTITKNNFKKYSFNEPWWERQVILIPFIGLVKDKKDIWIGNYWDTWKGIGSQRIRGILVLGIRFGEDGIAFGIPWIEYDWHPAKKPYYIGV